MPNIVTDTKDLYRQLFPYQLATDFIGDAHRALSFVTAPTHQGEELYQVLKTLKKRLEYVIEFAYSPRRRPYEDAIENAQEEIEILARAIHHYDLAFKGYPNALNLDFLSWQKNSLGFPAFMVMDMSVGPKFSIVAKVDKTKRPPTTTLTITPKLPVEVTAPYNAFKNLFVSKAESNSISTCTIAAKFGGSPPKSTDKKIDTADNSKLFKQFIIIAEAPNWEFDVIVEVKKDPIVAALSPVFHPVKKDDYGNPVSIGNHITFIDIFNLTHIEERALQSSLISPGSK